MNINSMGNKSFVKDGFKSMAEIEAGREEGAIRRQLRNDLDAQTYTKKPTGGMYFAGAVVCAILGAFAYGLVGFEIGAVIGLAVVGGISLAIGSSNKGVDNRKEQMSKDAEDKVTAVWQAAQQRYQDQCDKYDSDVKIYSKKILGNAKNVSPMVDHSVDMFERMISHSDAGSNRRFIETDFTYKVGNAGISYSYDSRYTNSMDDFNFSRERFHNLGSSAECEGLARALAKLIAAKMMDVYPKTTTTITLSHIDAEVTLHFKGANKNFVPARDIF